MHIPSRAKKKQLVRVRTDGGNKKKKNEMSSLQLTRKDTGVKMAVSGGRLREKMINTGDLQVLGVSDVSVEIVLAVLLSRWAS